MGFAMDIGPREPGFINWITRRPGGSVRWPVFFWRMYWSSLDLSCRIGDPMTRLHALRYAWACTWDWYFSRWR